MTKLWGRTRVGNKVVYSHILRAEIKSRLRYIILYIRYTQDIPNYYVVRHCIRPFRLFASGKTTRQFIINRPPRHTRGACIGNTENRHFDNEEAVSACRLIAGVQKGLNISSIGFENGFNFISDFTLENRF